ncbi:hypothetical protein BDN70DRAFT_343044 [Pholiota conissans]|uniref:HMG box domain-containing protein n=1 Tax=Pholiota conissans TaxID=109636 RepID=A0A9P6CXR6_9AGAR|nr:hypothetical protein BDN70DRAFT_343044 [Pholiota conissans]
MPADRTRTTQRSDSGNQLVWANSEPTTGSELAFAPNVTPITFSDSPPPLVDYPPTEFIMFPPAGELSTPRRQPHSKKKPENHIPRPPNAFILFRSSFIKSQHVSTEVETNHSTLSKIIGLTWQNMPEDQRQVWHSKAKEALEEHKRKFPKYAFKPVQTKAKGMPAEKRKVREVEPKDIKRCTKIAQLLVEGKKGDELNAAVQEFDKTHVPEIITRFEAPITARAYRRSSSAPVSDSDAARSSGSFLQHVLSSPRKMTRSASTRPTRCPSPVNDVVEQVCQESPYPTLDTQPLPLKQESAFNFGEFSFDNVASPLPAFDCDPLSFDAGAFSESHFNPGLTIDTSFSNVWESSPSPQSPSTPSYMMSPMSTPSPMSPYPSNFDTFDQMFDANFHSYDQTCGLPQDGLCGGGADDMLYSAFNENQFGGSQLSQLDLAFSAFMTAIPQYS